MLEGACYGVALSLLSAGPVRTPLALRPLAPHLAQARRGGFGHACPIRAPQAQTSSLSRAQTLRGPHPQAALRLVRTRHCASPSPSPNTTRPHAPDAPASP